MAAKPKKATITFLKGKNAGTKISVLFNPAEYSLEFTNSYPQTALPGAANPVLHFVTGQAQTLTMELLFDTYTDRGQGSDVTEHTNRIAQMLTIDPTLHAPPPVLFEWGPSFAFQAIVEKLSKRLTMFRDDGTPVRATLNITFKQYRPLREQLETTSPQSADKTKRRLLTSDDSLWLLAAREYREPRYWRLIARHNRIANPRLIEPGSIILLPPLEPQPSLGTNDGTSSI